MAFYPFLLSYYCLTNRLVCLKLHKDNLSVEVKDNHLLIKGERELNFESGSPVSKSTISKKYTIGEKYDQEKIKADLRDGILEIFFPFKKEKEKKVINLLK